MIKNIVIAYVCLLLPAISYADTLTRSLGNAVGEFSAGISAGAVKILSSQQPQWITINPRPKDECFAESGKVINAVYIRCRHGRQELVRFDANGSKIVLSERPIPMN